MDLNLSDTTRSAADAVTPAGDHTTPTLSTPEEGAASATGGAPALRAEGLTKTFGEGEGAVQALRGVDVAFARGRFSAIMGPSGSGKSTLLYLLAGLEEADAGTVWLGDTAMTGLDDDQLTGIRRDRIGFVFQAFNLLPMFTAEDNIKLPLELAGTDLDTQWFDQVVDTLDIRDRLGHRPSELSGGQQQRVAIARAMIARPDVILADEPTGNLDNRASREVLAFLRRCVRELGQTVIMVTHDPTAAAYAERVMLLADGRVAGQITDPTPDAVLAGLDAIRAQN
ncbi:MAG: ABC transporter ATP-binding protein [Bifidobacteriaceae bacterium]|jgi:putative ABC transport system ATP-binding protein|nr:ABC transporter ATP-binding protein [Bifidobacteriaceae bacterium]